MESLSRRPLRRKDPAANGGVSSKTPYEDVGFSNWDRGKGKVFEARDYAEIFAGSSSIPVFDISSLEQRVGSGEYRTSNLDYGDVFGGLRNYDVAVAYEDLLNHVNASVKESNPCVPVDRSMSSRDSGPRHPMMNGKRLSGEQPDPSADQEKEFYMSFSGTYQQNVNASDEKKEAEYTSDGRPEFSHKHEVSRTWSFSAQVESVSRKGQLKSSKPHDLNEVNRSPETSKVPQISSQNIFESNGKVLNQTKASSLASEGDDLGISVDESSTFLFMEGYDENSPAAVSAAALKKAVDDARERIRQAKFMMEKRKKGKRDGSKHRQMDHNGQVANDLDEGKPVNKNEDSDPVFTPSANYIDLVIKAGEGKASQNLELEKHGKNVKTIEVRKNTSRFTGPKAREECSTLNSLPGNIDNQRCFMPSGTVLASCLEKPENGNENLVSLHHMKETEGFKKELEKMVEEADQSSKLVHDSGNASEAGSIHISLSDQEPEKVYEKGNVRQRTSLEGQVVDQGDNPDGVGIEKEKICNPVEVPEQEVIEELVHKPAFSQEELEMQLKESLNYQQDGNLEKKINDDLSVPQEAEVLRVDDFLQTKTDGRKPADGGYENHPELSPTYDQSEDEQIKLDPGEPKGVEAIVVNADDCSDVRNSFTAQNIATTSCATGGAGRDEDHNNSVPQETEYEEFIHESIHVKRTDSDHDHKAEDYEEAVRSNTGNHTTTSEVDGANSTFCKEMEHEPSHPKGDQVFGAESLHQAVSDEDHSESKLHSCFEGISDSKDADTLVDNADHKENENITVISDAFRDSTADELKAPPIDSRTRETDPENVRNSQEQSSESYKSSPSTSAQDCADALSGFESKGVKQGASCTQEELKDEFGMVDEASSGEGQSGDAPSSQLNSGSDVKQCGSPAEATVVMENDKKMVGEKDAKEGVPNFVEDDQQQRIEAIRKGREREKDRLAVERAIREARERAKEKLERAAAEKQQAEKAATEAKLRAERAAVERATAEARERAFEKAKSLKTLTTNRSFAAEKVSISSRNDGLKHSFSSSDLEVTATYTESAQRHKARLERHQRVMERAAKALEEKNKRDLLVQKEQAERNRMAEYLDADIKRWSAGKEGNLRALLSTLHYILGAESGWKTVSLTEIITTADVKKAYRKATLCVHPDKVQQRGASVQQKYICEKVFDLLKAAWNKFNSEER